MTLNPTDPLLTKWDRTLSALGLTKIKPRVPVLSELRSMYVRPDIAAVLEGRTTKPFPCTRADAQNTVFAAGQFVTVSLLGDPGKRQPDLERLRGLDEAWAFCYRSPKPGWRLFGRWVDVGIFVGIQLWERHSLGFEENYNRKAEEMLADWSASYPGLDVVRGSSTHDYLRGNVRDVDRYTF